MCREGRPAFSSKTLLKLYLYGYQNRCRSSRQLMRVAQTNIELFWLLHEAKPCYKTIADFRKNNTRALTKTFSTFTQFLRGEGLLQGDTVAVDGTKIAAHNSKKNNYNPKKIFTVWIVSVRRIWATPKAAGLKRVNTTTIWKRSANG